MNQNERELLSDLRALADSDRSQAPSELRARLLVEFRARSARKRGVSWLHRAWLPAAGLGAIAAAVLFFLWMPNDVLRHRADAPVVASALAPTALPAADETDSDFYPLPEAEGLPPIENATVIRVQMPLESLQLMGVAVTETGVAEPIQADILLGQDGLARGVRLVQ